ncbi:MAG: hypothetical protein H0W72_02930 [Planctomycetes bacterium]|nr:hypothetical protein [Planctomycetota bacterium]
MYGYVADPHAETVNLTGPQADALERDYMLGRAHELKQLLLDTGRPDRACIVGWLIGQVRS